MPLDQEMPLDFTDFTPGSIIVHDIEGDFIFHHLNVLVDDSRNQPLLQPSAGTFLVAKNWVIYDYC